MLDDIPAPLVIRADRVSRDDREDMTAEDHRSQADILEKALIESCDYADQLWNDLATMRRYLHDSLPERPSPCGAAPFGPGDDAGWNHWQDAFAAISSTLCSPRGDSGFGRGSATLLARPHRDPDRSRDAEPTLARASNPGAVAAEPVSAPASPLGARDSETPAAPTMVGQMREPLIFATIGAVLAAVALRGRRHDVA